MSGYRWVGAFISAVLVVLLAIVTFTWARYTGVVRPSVSVVPESAVPARGEPSNPSPVTAAILTARTRIQADEVNRLPTAFPPLTGEEKLDFKPAVRTGDGLVLQWQQRGDGGAIARQSMPLSGVSSLPYTNAEVLEQPEGRSWRERHNVWIRFGGGWLIFGAGLALALFLFGRGRIRIAEGRSGQTIERFNEMERANHWMTATSFIIMALSGLVILYGKPLLLPLIGEASLGSVAWWSAWLHMSTAVPFVIGIVLMAVLWLRENLVTRLDIEWLKQFGGFLDDSPDKPSARRFNAGQKLVFWGVLLGGLAALATGIPLMVPFEWFGYEGMQWAQLLHAAIGLAFIALIMGHIYIGTVGMEGAIDAMWSGRVDRNWAKEHHDLWFDEATGGKGAATRSGDHKGKPSVRRDQPADPIARH